MIAYITDCVDFEDLESYHVIWFTKCYFGNHRFPRMSREMESLKFTRINKKIRRTATKWAGFNLMLYVLYGLGIVNILEDMKVEKTKEYEPKTARGKAAKEKRNEEKKPVRIAECTCSFSDGTPVRIVVENRGCWEGKREEIQDKWLQGGNKGIRRE